MTTALADDVVALEKPMVEEDAFFVGGAITRKQLADFVVDAVVEGKFVKKGVGIGSKPQ